MFIQTEVTPNPATLKFLPGRNVLVNGTLDLPSRESAAQSPLAARLFDIPNVGGVFFGSDFISVTKTDGDWQQMKPAILGAIMEHYMSGCAATDRRCEPIGSRGGRIFRREGCGDGRHHQGSDRDPCASSRGRRRRRHNLPWLQGRHRVPQYEGRMLGLPVFNRDPQARHPELAASLRT